MNKFHIFMLVLLAQLPLGAMQKAADKRLQKIESDYQKNKEYLFTASGGSKAQKMLHALGSIKLRFKVHTPAIFELEEKLSLACDVSRLLKFHAHHQSPITQHELYELVDILSNLNQPLLKTEAPAVKMLPAAHSLKTVSTFNKLKNLSPNIDLRNDALVLYESDADGNSLVHVAVQKNKFAAIDSLLSLEQRLVDESQADFNYLSEREKKYQRIAFRYDPETDTEKKPSEVTIIPTEPFDLLLEQRNKAGQTPLVFAASLNNSNALLHVVNHNPNVNAQDQQGKTALHYAAQLKNHHMLGILFTQKGILANRIDAEGYNPFDRLLSSHKFTTSDNDLCLCLAMFKTHRASLYKLKDDQRAQLVLSINLQPSSTKKKSQSAATRTVSKLHPLLHACIHNKPAESIEKIMEHGSDANFMSNAGLHNRSIKAQTGFTQAPVFQYMLMLNKHLFATLLQYEGLDLNIKNSNDETILDLIARDAEKHYLIPMVIVYGANCFKGKNIIPDPLYATIIDGVLHNQIMITFDSKAQAYVFATIT